MNQPANAASVPGSKARDAGIDAVCKLMQDPRVDRGGPGRKLKHVPVYEVVLTARRAGGGASGRATLVLAADEPVRLRLDRGEGQDLVIVPGRPVEVRSNATGKARITIDAVGFTVAGRTVLRCPLLKVRTGDMPANRWDVIAPDREAHAELAGVTGDMLLTGLAARIGRHATRSPLRPGVSRADADELAASIRGLMGAAGLGKLAVDDSGPVAFADGEAANVEITGASSPGLVGRVSHADAPLRRVIPALELPLPESEVVSFAAGDADGDAIYDVTFLGAPSFADDGDAQAFGLGEAGPGVSRTRELQRELRRIDAEIERATRKEDRAQRTKLRAEKAAEFGRELKAFLGKAVLQPLEGVIKDIVGWARDAMLVVLDTFDPKGVLIRTYQVVIDDGSKVVRAVVDSVESALDVMGAFFDKLGAKCKEVVEFLAALFDWGDILETADGLLAVQQAGLQRLPGFIKTLRGKWAGLTATLETTLTAAIDGAIASLQGGQAVPTKSSPPSGADRDERSSFLFNKVEDNFESASSRFAIWKPDGAMMAEFEKALDLKGALKGLDAPGIWKEFKDSLAALDLGDMFTSLQEFFSDGASALLVGLKAFVKLLVRLLSVAGDLVLRFAGLLLDVAIKVLDLHLDIPFLTDFIEGTILGGRKLTLLTLLSVLAAIPFTVAYKLAHGTDHGPFGGAVSFAGDANDNKGFNDTVAGFVNVACSFVSGIVITLVDIADDDMAAPRVLKVASSAASLVVCGVTGFPTDNTDKAVYGVAVTNWMVGLVGAIIGIADASYGLYLTVKDEEDETTEDAFRYVSGGIGIVQLVLAIVAGAMETVREKQKPVAERAIGDVWLGASANLIGGLVAAMPIIPDDPKTLKLVKIGAASVLISAQTAIGVTYCVRSMKATA